MLERGDELLVISFIIRLFTIIATWIIIIQEKDGKSEEISHRKGLLVMQETN